MIYFLKVSFCWALFYGCYLLILRNETFFRENRIYLVGSLILSLIFPLIPSGDVIGEIMPGMVLPVINTALAYASQPEVNDSIFSLKLIYWIGVAIMAVRFLLSLGSLIRIRFSGKSKIMNGVRVIQSKSVPSPFSFFRTLYLPLDPAGGEEAQRQIFTHEVVHIRELHSLDLLFAEVLSIFFWFNPFIFWYKKSIQHIHEYLADEAVLRVANRKHYHRTLIEQAVPGLQLGHQFSQSQLKNRFNMMKRVRSNQNRKFKYLLFLPIALMAMMLSTEGLAQKMAVAETSDQTFTVVEKMPLFPGCDNLSGLEAKNCSNEKLIQHILANFKYPKEAEKAGTEGTVLVEFIVNKKGEIEKVKAKREVANGCTEAALKMVSTMPNWTPGEQRGKKVNVKMVLPIQFKL